MTDSYCTDTMEATLSALASVRPFDYDAAYRVALGGSSAARMSTKLGLAAIRGHFLALDLWRNQMSATIALRYEA